MAAPIIVGLVGVVVGIAGTAYGVDQNQKRKTERAAFSARLREMEGIQQANEGRYGSLVAQFGNNNEQVRVLAEQNERYAAEITQLRNALEQMRRSG